MANETATTTRNLRRVPLPNLTAPGQKIITMSVGQWDDILMSAYNRGWILLELNDDEEAVAAYQKAPKLDESTH